MHSWMAKKYMLVKYADFKVTIKIINFYNGIL